MADITIVFMGVINQQTSLGAPSFRLFCVQPIGICGRYIEPVRNGSIKQHQPTNKTGGTKTCQPKNKEFELYSGHESIVKITKVDP